MTTPLVVDRSPLTTAAFTRLQTITSATTKWLGKPTAPLPLVPGSDGRVKPYVILWPNAGTPSLEQDLADTAVDLDWTLRITCGAGTVDDVMAVVTEVDALFYRWAPVIEGLVCGAMKPPPGYQPNLGTDETVKPPRPFVPLQYVSTITAT